MPSFALTPIQNLTVLSLNRVYLGTFNSLEEAQSARDSVLNIKSDISGSVCQQEDL